MKIEQESPYMVKYGGFIKWIMRTFIFLTFFTALGFTPNNGFSQKTKVFINNEGALSIEALFELINEQTGYEFVYRFDLVENAEKVHLKKGPALVERLLQKALTPIDCGYEILEDTIIVKRQEGFLVKGQVTDAETGVPLPGVTVLIKGTNKGTTTDFDGNYIVKVPSEENVLVFSYLGFEDKEVIIGTNRLINVALDTNVEQLDEVVLTDGYRKLERDREPGSYVSVDTDLLIKQPSNDILQSLEGLSPGLIFNPTSNGFDDGEQNPDIFIRGVGSFGTIEPLYILDGFPVSRDDLQLVNVNDIEGVTILKDAASTSIWGANAANGVIVITTKRGKGTKPKFNFSSTVTTGRRPTRSYLNLMNSAESVQTERDYFYRDEFFTPVRDDYRFFTLFRESWEALFDYEDGLISETERDNRLNDISSRDNSRQLERLLFQPSENRINNLSVSGKSGILGYFGSLGYNTYESGLKNDSREQFNGTFNGDFEFSDKTNLSIGINYLRSEESRSPFRNQGDATSEGTVLTAVPLILYTSPYVQFSEEDGMPRNYSQGFIDNITSLGGKDLTYNPYNELKNNEDKTIRNTLRTNLKLTQELLPGLEAEGRMQYIVTNSDRENLYKEDSYYVRHFLATTSEGIYNDDDELIGIEQVVNDGAILENTNVNYRSLMTRAQLNYHLESNNEKHVFDLSVGGERRAEYTKTTGVNYYGLNEDNLSYQVDLAPILLDDYSSIFNSGVSSSGITIDFSSLSKFERKTSSYYVNGTYSFDKKYHLNLSGRRDRSNLFSKGKKDLGSVGLKWNLGKENFLVNSNAVNTLDLRASYGVVGKTPDIGQASLENIAYTEYNTSILAASLGIANPAITNLTFEVVRTTNLGMDFELFNKRVFGALDLYNKKSTDVIAPNALNPTTGFFFADMNVADIDTKGAELSLSVDIIRTKSFNWRTTVNASIFENEVTRSIAPTDVGSVVGKENNQITGFQTYTVLAYENAGLDETGLPQVYYTDDSGVKQATSDLSLVGFDDLVDMGTSIPTKSIGFLNNFTYKGFELFARFAYRGGHVISRESYNLSILTNNFFDGFLPAYNKIGVDYWNEPGDEETTDIPALIHTSDDAYDAPMNSDKWFVPGDYIKLRQLRLGYNFNKKQLDKLPFSSLRFSLQGDNLWRWTKNDEGIDPEAYRSNAGQRTLDIAPTYSFNVSVGF
ncbi:MULTISPECIES: SusC/RagA family TonB-linked outer membrane protein [Flavobacteriaceae]|uniref:SusC/RagA family TonB-linked outer membrane protein n=1 Tax=Flavobacteriaceae TaxID=49546 RepID=UPI001490C8C8|nr:MULTISPECIES: SusC/RagA family TonB-linked outer membrane protein [Allomuricauda]MDC6366798.1 SusC/RagA family TonB-linked outer membrane protein [Muricauda sp. AC10]